MIPMPAPSVPYNACPHCAREPASCPDRETCALCRCDYCERKRRFVVLVCGGRDFDDRAMVWGMLDSLHAMRPITRIVHGDAKGADKLASDWARSRGVGQDRFPADWKNLGRSAGPLRNAEMLAKSKPDLCVAFPGRRGTADMMRRATREKVSVLLVRSDGSLRSNSTPQPSRLDAQGGC